MHNLSLEDIEELKRIFNLIIEDPYSQGNITLKQVTKCNYKNHFVKDTFLVLKKQRNLSTDKQSMFKEMFKNMANKDK